MKKILFGVAISLLLPGFVSAQTCSARLMGVGMPGEQARIVCGRDANATHLAQYFSNGTNTADMKFATAHQFDIGTRSNYDLRLLRNGTSILVLGSSAVTSSLTFSPSTTSALDFGATTNRWKDAYINRTIEAVSTKAGAGTTQTDATAITDPFTYVTLSDGTVGVRLPAGVIGATYKVHNTVSGQNLKVYPPTSGAINGGSANANVVVAGLETGFFTLVAANTWVGGVAVNF